MDGLNREINDFDLIIKNGKIAQIKSDSKKINNLLKKTFYKFGPKSKVLAEIGIGLNKKAKLSLKRKHNAKKQTKR